MKQQVYEAALKRIVEEIDEREEATANGSPVARAEARRNALRVVKDIARGALGGLSEPSPAAQIARSRIPLYASDEAKNACREIASSIEALDK